MIKAKFEWESGRIRRVYASAEYPSQQKGNVFFDSEIVPNLKFAEELSKQLECLHAVVAFRASHILLSRDVLGGKPLYFDHTGISSFRYTLIDPEEVMPGEIVKISYEGEVLQRKTVSFEEVMKAEQKSLSEIEEEIEKELRSMKPRNCCIAFSGGLDSAFLSSIYDLPLISVTASDSEEEWIREVGRRLSRELEIKRITEEEVARALEEIPNIIEEDSFLQLSIAIPVHFAMKFAKELGFESIIFGQGADELFGGYKRYEELKAVELQRALIEDIKNIGVRNLVRDAKLSYFNEIGLTLPYLRWNIVRNSLSIPPELKVARIDGRVVRKYFLRKMAEKYLPREVVWKEKKAIQYSTGVAKILRRLYSSQTGRDPGF